MKLKKLLSICLVGAMAATLLTACGSSDETVGEEIEDDAEEVVEDVKDVAEDVGEGVEDAVEDVGEDVKDAAEEAVEDVKDNAEEEESGGSFAGFDDTITIKGYGLTLFTDDGVEEVVDAVNEISIPAINVELDYDALDVGSYSEQVGLMLAGGESFDLVMIIPMDAPRFSVMQSKNQLLDISGYVDEYAPETMELLGEYVEPYWVDGALYGLPDFHYWTNNFYVMMRQDITDYLGLTEQAEAISSWSDLEAIFEAVYAAQDELPEELQTPCMITSVGNTGQIIPTGGGDLSSDDFADHVLFDSIGEANSMIYVDDDGIVQCSYTADFTVETFNRVRQWYENGWVNKDAMTTNDDADTQIRNGLAFCIINSSDTAEVGVAAAEKLSTGYDMICVPCGAQQVQTNSAIHWGWGVPVTAEQPEAAVAFLNLMYTNTDVENLFVWGIEGRDYELNEEGEAVVLEDAVYQSNDFLYGNQFTVYPGEGQGSDFREIALEQALESEISPYYGFNVDSDPIDAEESALSIVLDQYLPSMNSGTVEASELFDDFVAALDSAGLQELLDYYQENLDAWLAEQ